MASEFVTPGQRIALATEFSPSVGTYQRGDHIYASVVGKRQISQSTSEKLPLLQVIRNKEPSSIPEIGSIVTCRVIRIQPTQATVNILVVGTTPCTETFQGIIRVQEVRATERDKVQISKCFRPGDIVRAEVISLGDARSYLLSTAKNEHGVIFAKSISGHTMVPINWEKMMCPKTKEVRKALIYKVEMAYLVREGERATVSLGSHSTPLTDSDPCYIRLLYPHSHTWETCVLLFTVLDDDQDTLALPTWLYTRLHSPHSLSILWTVDSVSTPSINHIYLSPLPLKEQYPVLQELRIQKISLDVWAPTSKGIELLESVERKGDNESGGDDWNQILLDSLDGHVVENGSIVCINVSTNPCIFKILTDCTFSKIDSRLTKLEIGPSDYSKFANIDTFTSVYKSQVGLLSEVIESRVSGVDLYAKFGFSVPKCGVVYGPSGVDFLEFIEYVCYTKLNVAIVKYSIGEIFERYENDQEDRGFEDIWKRVCLSFPAVLVLTDLELLNTDIQFDNFDKLSAVKYLQHSFEKLFQILGADRLCVVSYASDVDLQKFPRYFQVVNGTGTVGSFGSLGGGEKRMFDFGVEVGVLMMEQRKDIIYKLLEECKIEPDLPNMSSNSKENLLELYAHELSTRTPGYLPHQICKIIQLALTSSYPRQLYNLPPSKFDSLIQFHSSSVHSTFDTETPSNSTNEIDATLVRRFEKMRISLRSAKSGVVEMSGDVRGDEGRVSWVKDIFPALSKEGIGSSADGKFEVTKPDVSWDDIAGYETTKKRLQQLVTVPISKPDLFKKMGIRAPSGILLYGPSGCGKTLFARAVADSAGVNFVCVKSNQIFSKYLGDSESSVRELFTFARKVSPCIIFIDQIETIAIKRGSLDGTSSSGVNERVLSTLLNELDGIEERSGVIVIGCTTQPHKIDEAMLRPGRLEHHVYIPPPTPLDRRKIFESGVWKSSFEKGPQSDDVFWRFLKVKTTGFSCADMKTLIREAGVFAIRESKAGEVLYKRHFIAALLCASRKLPLIKSDVSHTHSKSTKNGGKDDDGWVTESDTSSVDDHEVEHVKSDDDEEDVFADARKLVRLYRSDENGNILKYWNFGTDADQLNELNKF